MYVEIRGKLQQGKMQPKIENYELGEDEIFMFKGIIYVRYDQELKNLILTKMHKVPYVGHPGYQKTIVAIKKAILLARYEKGGC
jgi:hypothetical protein